MRYHHPIDEVDGYKSLIIVGIVFAIFAATVLYTVFSDEKPAEQYIEGTSIKKMCVDGSLYLYNTSRGGITQILEDNGQSGLRPAVCPIPQKRKNGE